MRKTYLVVKDMANFYKEYIETISKMPPSLKTLNLLVNVCMPGDRVLELGSGFSTFCLAFYKELIDYTHWAVDNSNEWLGKTKGYCLKYGYTPTCIITWDKLTENEPSTPFNVVFFDIGKTNVRVSYLEYVLDNLIDPYSLVLMDDMHKGIISGGTYKILKKYHYREIPVRDQTLDEFGRFCTLITGIRRR